MRIFTHPGMILAVASLAVLLTYWASQNMFGVGANGRISENSNLKWVHHAPYVNHFLLPQTFNWSAAPVTRPSLDEVSRFDVDELSGIALFWEAYVRGRPAVVTGFQNLQTLATAVSGRKENEMFLSALRESFGSMQCPLTIGKVVKQNGTRDQVEPRGKVVSQPDWF